MSNPILLKWLQSVRPEIQSVDDRVDGLYVVHLVGGVERTTRLPYPKRGAIDAASLAKWGAQVLPLLDTE